MHGRELGWYERFEGPADFDKAVYESIGYGAWRFFIRWVAPIAVAAIIVFVIRGTDFS